MFGLFKSMESFLENVDQQAANISTPDAKAHTAPKAQPRPETSKQTLPASTAPVSTQAAASPSDYAPKSSFKSPPATDTGFEDDWEQQGSNSENSWQNDDFGDTSDWTRTPSKFQHTYESDPAKEAPQSTANTQWSPNPPAKGEDDFWDQDDDWGAPIPHQPLPTSTERVSSPAKRTESPSTHVKEEIPHTVHVVPSFGDWENDASLIEDAPSTEVPVLNSEPTEEIVEKVAESENDLFAAQPDDTGAQEWDFDSPMVIPPVSEVHKQMNTESEAVEGDFDWSESGRLDSSAPVEMSSDIEVTPPNAPELHKSDPELSFGNESIVAPVHVSLNPSMPDSESLWNNDGDDELFKEANEGLSQPEGHEFGTSSSPSSVVIHDVRSSESQSKHDDQSHQGDIEEHMSVEEPEPEISVHVDSVASDDAPPFVDSSIHYEEEDTHEMTDSTTTETELASKTLHSQILATPSSSALTTSQSSIKSTSSASSLPSLATPIEEGKEALKRLSLVQSKLKEQHKLIEHLNEEKKQLLAQLKSQEEATKRRESEMKSQMQVVQERVAVLEKQVSTASQQAQKQDSAAHQAELERLKEEHKKNQEAVVNHLTDQVNRYAKMNDELKSRFEEKKTQLVATLDEKKRFIVSLEGQIAGLKAEHVQSDRDFKKRDEEERRKREETWQKERAEAEEKHQKQISTLTTRLDAALASITKKDDQIKSLEHENGILAGEVAIRKTGEAEEAKRAWELKETMAHSIEHSTAQLEAQIQDLKAQNDIQAQEHTALQAQLAKAHAKSERATAALQTQLDERLDLYSQLEYEYSEYKTRAAAHLKQLENQLEIEKRHNGAQLAGSSHAEHFDEQSSHNASLGISKAELKENSEKILELVNSGLLASISPSHAQNLKNMALSMISDEDRPTDAEHDFPPVSVLHGLLTLLTTLLSQSQTQSSRMLLELEELKSERHETKDVLPPLIDPLRAQVDRLQQDVSMRSDKIEQLEQHIASLQNDIRANFDNEALREQKWKDAEKSLEMKLSMKDEEMLRLKRQLAARTAAVTSQTELESRVKFLSDQLIAKQSTIEAMEAERRSYEDWQTGIPGTASKPKRSGKRVSLASSSNDSGDVTMLDSSVIGDEMANEGDIESQSDNGLAQNQSGNVWASANPFEASSFSEARSRLISRARIVGRNVSSKLNANPIARRIASFFPRSVPMQLLLFSYFAFLQLLVFYLMSSSSSSAANATGTDSLLEKTE